MKIKTTRDIVSEDYENFMIDEVKYDNSKKWVPVDEELEFLEYRVVSLKNMIDTLNYVRESSNNTLDLKRELEYELEAIKERIKGLKLGSDDEE